MIAILITSALAAAPAPAAQALPAAPAVPAAVQPARPVPSLQPPLRFDRSRDDKDQP